MNDWLNNLVFTHWKSVQKEETVPKEKNRDMQLHVNGGENSQSMDHEIAEMKPNPL